MDQHEIHQLMESDIFTAQGRLPELVETHISWVILAGQFAYKIKKPVKFSFLDFSTLAKRKRYCQREVELNQRLAGNMYIQSIPIFKQSGHFSLNPENGKLLDYAVWMHRKNNKREMDKLLERNKVSDLEIMALAVKIANFHRGATVKNGHLDIEGLRRHFNDIEELRRPAAHLLGPGFADIIARSVDKSNLFLTEYNDCFQERSSRGFVRDVHGDLHTGNIFLYKDPVIFDCIEFNDSMRQIDVLNEIAFLCMDLEAYGRKDLSKKFYQYYLRHSGVKWNKSDFKLFHYYKCSRANIRAKVCLLRAGENNEETIDSKNLLRAQRYLMLLKNYIARL